MSVSDEEGQRDQNFHEIYFHFYLVIILAIVMQMGFSDLNCTKMLWRKHLGLLLLMIAISLTFLHGVCLGGELSETHYLMKFLRTIDTGNSLRISFDGPPPDACSGQWVGVKCNIDEYSVREINIQYLNLSGKIDADSLCKLPALQVLNLANNLIIGTIPDSISNCITITHLNLSRNLLHGMVPTSLKKLKNLQSLDMSNNNLSGPLPEFSQRLELVYPNATEATNNDYMGKNNTVTAEKNISGQIHVSEAKPITKNVLYKYVLIFLAIASFSMFINITNKRIPKASNEKEKKQELQETPLKIVTTEAIVDTMPREDQAELAFFIEEREKFTLADLFGSAADLQGQTLLSSLYKVSLKNDTILVVKRLKRLQVTVEEFKCTMTRVGNLKHPNLLPLVAHHSSSEEKLLIYKYQRNKSLFHLLENYAQGKRDFPWRHRLSIAVGIARGLDYIYRKVIHECAPHGNLKLSNILLSETEEPLISEYGFQRFIDQKRALLYSSNGYIAPEKTMTEKADVYSLGVILLVLLTGKMVERSDVDLIRWVKAMIREEWTGEVFDKEVSKTGKEWAFPLLNISLKCVANLPENRPSITDVLDKIEEVAYGQEDASISSTSSIESNQQEGCLLHTVIPEISETPSPSL